MRQEVLIQFLRDLKDVPVASPGLQFERKPLPAFNPGNPLRARVNERVLLHESFAQRFNIVRVHITQHPHATFLFRLRNDLVPVGIEDIPSGLSFFLRFSQSCAWRRRRTRAVGQHS
jgi:hypothetical protein